MTAFDTAKNDTPAKTRVFSQPLRQNPRAIRPLYAVIFASACWEAAALLTGSSTGRTQDHFGEAFVLAGLAFLLFAVIGSIVYRHFRAALLSLTAALLITYSGYKYAFLWIFCPWYPVLWIEQAFGPVFTPEYLQTHLAALWLCLQSPFILLALWRCRWPCRVKIGTTALAGVGIICFFGVITWQANYEAAAALHVSGDYLSSVYSKNDRAAMQPLNHKRLVVTGVALGADEGLFGGPPDKIGPQIECDALAGGDTLAEGQTVSVLGTCEGEDAYGMIHLADCRVVR